MKRVLSIIMVLFCLITVSCWNSSTTSKVPYEEDGIGYYTKLDDKYFNFFDGEDWNREFVKGVNMGVAKPGYFPGELAITKKEYLRWFKQIGEMNANTIRVYTIQQPVFYEALLEYNEKAEKPLYLMHGVWVNEEDIVTILNAYDPTIKDTFKSDVKDLIDILHGNAEIQKKQGHASGVYKSDVSKYVTGLILGIEWDPVLVTNTDEVNSTKTNYKGDYLYTENASPFESFLCEIGDLAISYETENYNMQVPISFSNWVTTDMLSHPNEPLEKEDMASVNTEHIKHNNKFKPGLFASYHIYPYYPDFMNYEHGYVEFVDEDGNINTYKAYLKDLIKEHTVPVIVAEFGVPASRGITHRNIYTGFNQGFIDEKTQGEMDKSMLQDIYDTGYAGGLVFTWQDEWFKRTWNNMDYDIPDRRAYWSNTQTNEQQFGLLAFDPGDKESTCYVDGDISEWKRRTPLVENEKISLYTNYDEKYLYIMLKAKDEDIDLSKERLVIPFDITNKSGSNIYENVNLNKEADFVVDINGTSDSKMKVHSYYDVYNFSYGKELGFIPLNPLNEIKDSNTFNPIYVCLNKELLLPADNKKIPFESFETGKLNHGNANPKSEDYNSLSDFMINKNVMEMKIPWQLLNVMDPSQKKVMDDFYEKGIVPMEVEDISIGVYSLENNDQFNLEMTSYSWHKWDQPIYHERLKPSYFIMKETMEKIGKDIK